MVMIPHLVASETAGQCILPVDEIRQGGRLGVQKDLHYCLYDMWPSSLPPLSSRIFSTANCRFSSLLLQSMV